MKKNLFDAIIVGAGASGLMAALELALTGKNVLIMESRNRTGGRIHTLNDPRFGLPVEMGAEFVHGNLSLTKSLLKKASADLYAMEGGVWRMEENKLQKQEDFIEDYRDLKKQFKKLQQDVPVGAFLESYLNEERFSELRLTLRDYVEGYYAADVTKASTFSLRDELENSGDEQYRIEGTYEKLLLFMEEAIVRSGVTVQLSSPVTEIMWKENFVEVHSSAGIFSAEKVLLTVSVGVLQEEVIRFRPALPQKMMAARKLGFGPVIKTVIQFAEPFWKNKAVTQNKDLSKLSFLFSREKIPTWWTYYPKDVAMITGWSGGPHAIELKDLPDEEIFQTGLQSLSAIFSIPIDYLRNQVKGWHVANWVTDPWCRGGYSYEVVDGSLAKKELKKPVSNTIYFTGEGLFEGPEIGTVDAALQMGREAAFQMIATFKK